MSAVIPTHVVDHVMQGPRDTARVACNRLPGSNPDEPALVIVANAVGWVQLLEMMKTAIEHAPDADTKSGWKGFALQVTSAIQGAITS